MADSSCVIASLSEIITNGLISGTCSKRLPSRVHSSFSFLLALKSFFSFPNQQCFSLPDCSTTSSSPLTKVFPSISLIALAALSGSS